MDMVEEPSVWSSTLADGFGGWSFFMVMDPAREWDALLADALLDPMILVLVILKPVLFYAVSLMTGLKS